MRIFLKLGISIILIPFIVGYSTALFEIIKIYIHSYRQHWEFLTGAGSGLLLFPIMHRNKFMRTFEHEMTHLIFAKIFFGKIKELNVSSEGEGYVEYSSAQNPFIGLSPYFFPLFSAVFAGLIPLLNPAFSRYLFIAIGYFLIFHLLSAITEIFSLQLDIKQEGIIFSLVFITFFMIFCYGIIISEAISYHQILIFLKTGFFKSLSMLISIKDYILSLIIIHRP